MAAADEPDFEQEFELDEFHEFDGGGGGNSEAMESQNKNSKTAGSQKSTPKSIGSSTKELSTDWEDYVKMVNTQQTQSLRRWPKTV